MSSVIEQLRAAGVECYTRSEWGSPRERDGSYARRRGTHPMPSGPADFHFLHITVTADSDLPADGKAAARTVESYGLSTPPMVSYQDLVTNEGRYFEGQSYGVKGTHTVNDKAVPGYPNDLNLRGYACALMQNVQDDVTDAQVHLVAMVFAARELAGLVRKGAPIHPHRTFDWKSCPGDKAVARLEEIRDLRDKYVREGLPRAGSEDTVSWDQELGKWAPGDKDKTDKATAGQQLGQARGFAQGAFQSARRAERAAKRTERAVEALAKALGPEVEAAVRDALADAVVDVDVTVGGEGL